MENKTDKKHWGPVAALSVALLAYILSQVVIVLPLVILKIKDPGLNIDNATHDSAGLAFLLAILSYSTMVAVLLLFLKLRGMGVKDLGFKKITVGQMLLIIPAGLAYVVLIVMALTLANAIPGFDLDQAQDVGYEGVRGVQLVLAFVGLVVLPPFAEEMLFRGFLYRGLARRWPKILAAVVASGLFGLVHFQWNVGVDVFILSLVMIVLLEKTQNLWTCIGLHMVKNGIAFISLFLLAAR